MDCLGNTIHIVLRCCVDVATARISKQLTDLKHDKPSKKYPTANEIHTRIALHAKSEENGACKTRSVDATPSSGAMRASLAPTRAANFVTHFG